MATGAQEVNYYVTDTHALFWYLTASPRLGHKAKASFEEGERGEAWIFIPAIVLAEIYFLNQKIGQPLDFADMFSKLRACGQFFFVAFNAEDILSFDYDASVSEMHDRIIVGVARRWGAVCITTDAENSSKWPG